MHDVTRLRSIATLTLLAVLAASCSSDSSPGGSATFDATAAAKKLQGLGTVGISGSGKDAAGKAGPITGRLNRTDADVGFPFATTAELANVRIRRLGSTAWIRRAQTNQPISIGAPLVVLRRSGRPPWFLVNLTNSFGKAIFEPYDPVSLLTDLGTANAKFAAAKDADVGGSNRRGFTTTPDPKVAAPLGIRSVTVWVDDKDVPVRIAAVTTNGVTATYDITRSKGPLKATAPAPGQIDHPQAAPKAEGPFAVVASGTAGSVAYRILRAPGTDGWACWRVESTPPYVPASEPGPDGDLCTPPITIAGTDVLDRVSFPIDALAASGYEMIGFVVPPGSTGEVVLADGTTHKPMLVDGDGLALFTGPVTDIAGIAILNLPGNVKLYCAPGPVQTPQDLPPERLQFGATSSESLRDLPWNCLPADALE